MARKNLSIESITETAAKLVEEKGYDNFSLRELAARLDVKAASLYNHVSGIEEISTAVGLLAVERLNHALSKAAEGKERNDAVRAVALAYRAFAKENPDLYRAVIGMPLSENDTLVHAVSASFEPIMNVVHSYIKHEEKSMHISRSFRSAMHGFVSLEAAGFLRHYDVSIDESYHFMIESYIQMLMASGDD